MSLKFLFGKFKEWFPPFDNQIDSITVFAELDFLLEFSELCCLNTHGQRDFTKNLKNSSLWETTWIWVRFFVNEVTEWREASHNNHLVGKNNTQHMFCLLFSRKLLENATIPKIEAPLPGGIYLLWPQLTLDCRKFINNLWKVMTNWYFMTF